MKNSEAEIKRLEREIDRYKSLNKQLEALNGQLEAELKRAESEAAALRRTVNEAKDPSPVKRCSFKRVAALASAACLTILRDRKGWLLKFGNLVRRFRCLRQIWEILVQDSWTLSEVFKPNQDTELRYPQRHACLAPATGSDRPSQPVWEGF